MSGNDLAAIGKKYQHINLMIGTPCYGGNVTVDYMLGQLALARYGLNIHYAILATESLVTRARNTIVAQFLSNPNLTHLLFIDADIGFEPQTVLRLLDAGKPVVSSVYPHKRLDWDRIKLVAPSAADGKDLEQKSLSYVATLKDLDNIEHENGFIKVHDAPTGFMLIERSVFDVLRKKYPEQQYRTDQDAASAGGADPDNFWLFFDTMVDPDSKRYLSEDYAFCRKWQMAGGETWIDIMSSLVHVGRYAFHGDISKLFTIK